MNVGDIIGEGRHDALRRLPDGSEVEVISSGHRYVKGAELMERVGGDRRLRVDRFHARVRITYLPTAGKNHRWNVGDTVTAEQLKELPVGIIFTGGGERRPRIITAPAFYGYVEGGGTDRVDYLRGEFTINRLPLDDVVETLIEFKDRMWRVTRPYARDGYTAARTTELLRELGITEHNADDGDTRTAQEYKDHVWTVIAGHAKNKQWCATWKKPLAELGITDPATRPKAEPVATELAAIREVLLVVAERVQALEGRKEVTIR